MPVSGVLPERSGRNCYLSPESVIPGEAASAEERVIVDNPLPNPPRKGEGTGMKFLASLTTGAARLNIQGGNRATAGRPYSKIRYKNG